MRALLFIQLGLCCGAIWAQEQPVTSSLPVGRFEFDPLGANPVATAGSPATLPADAGNGAATAIAPPQATGGATIMDDKHKLLPGDRVTFRILEDRDPPNAPQKILTVSDSGELDVPYIGLVRVAGKTCRQAIAEITKLLEKDYYYKATVILGLESANKSIGRVYLSGQVRRQGAQEIPANETFTASKAILRADGFGEFANKKKVKVIRNFGNEKQTFEVNMEDVLEKGEMEKDVVLQPDDYIIVPQRLINM